MWAPGFPAHPSAAAARLQSDGRTEERTAKEEDG